MENEERKPYTQEEIINNLMAAQYSIKNSKEFQDLITDAVDAGLVTDGFNTNYRTMDELDISPMTVKDMYLHISNGSENFVYPLSVDLRDNTATLEESDRITEEQFAKEVKQRENARVDFEIRQGWFNEMTALDIKNPENVLDYLSKLEDLVSENIVSIKNKDGSYSKVNSMSDINFSEMNRLRFQINPNERAKSLNQKDITDYLAAGAGIKAPAEPHSWGPFQFIKGIANTIKKRITGKGFKEYEDYDKAKKEYEVRKYVEMKGNRYSYNEPANVADVIKEKVLEDYAQMAYETMVDDFNKDYPGKKNPLDNPDVQDRFKETLLASPQADQLIEHAGVTEYLKALLDDGQTELGHDVSFKKAVEDVMKDDVIQPFVNTLEKPYRIEKMRNTIAEKTTENIKNALKVPEDEKGQAFLDAMKEIMMKGTPREEGIRHLLQSAVALNDMTFLNRVQSEFHAKGKESVTNSLRSLVDVGDKKCAETFTDWGINSMSKELKDKLYVTQNTVEAKVDRSMAKAFKPEDLDPDLEKEFKSVQNTQASI